MTIDEAKKQWDKVSLDLIFADMVKAMPADWMPTWEEFAYAKEYANSWHAKGVYPSHFFGPISEEMAFGACPNMRQWWDGVKSYAQAAYDFVAEKISAAWSFITTLGKARRHKSELMQFAYRNPRNFVLGWNPGYRCWDKYVEHCGLDLAIKRVQDAIAK